MLKFTRNIASAAGIALAALTMTACAGSQEAQVTEEVEVTGEPVTLNEELTALCAQVVEQGLPSDAASALAEASGYAFAIIQDGDPAPAQATDVIFTVRDDTVIACSPG
jgi:membrane-bound lytic murein transglycosylase B